jgi:UDPglucose 6-dehydrogenase
VGVDYANMINDASADPRIGPSHTRVPGPDGKRGFGGTCFPKDMSSLIAQCSTHNVLCPLMQSARSRNDEHDRSEQDWLLDKGRAVI